MIELVGTNILESGDYIKRPNGVIVRKEPKKRRNDINPATGVKYKKEKV